MCFSFLSDVALAARNDFGITSTMMTIKGADAFLPSVTIYCQIMGTVFVSSILKRAIIFVYIDSFCSLQWSYHFGNVELVVN